MHRLRIVNPGKTVVFNRHLARSSLPIGYNLVRPIQNNKESGPRKRYQSTVISQEKTAELKRDANPNKDPDVVNTNEKNNSNSSQSIKVLDKNHNVDEWTNISKPILDKLGRNLINQKAHPSCILKEMVFSQFPTFAHYDTLEPVVSTYDNFDSLLVPKDHPSRAKSDTYYINENTVLRAHTSAHQVQLLKAGAENNLEILKHNKNQSLVHNTTHGSTKKNTKFLVAADVFRRDEIDGSHYPIFHQLEAVSTFSKDNLENELKQEESARQDVKKKFLESMQDKPSLTIETHNEGYDAIKNPIQKCHDPKQVELIINDMKSAMNNMVASILSQAANTVGQEEQLSKLQVRWIEAYFPFTSPSWEMEVFWGGEWLELCGCGVMRQELLQNAKLDDRIGWAFGFGLERLAMVLFGIPDIRLFWSSDPRFLGQFEPGKISRFVPFSKHPACHKDISFWIGKAGNTNVTFHENDMNDLIREIAGDLVQDVVLVDEFTSKKTNRTSKCYRINYCSMDRNVTNEEINAIQERVRKEMSERLDIELR